MIEPMLKVYCVARARDRDRLLATIREAGAVHLVPVDRKKAVAGEATRAAIDRLGRAIQALGSVEPAGEAPAGLAPREAAEEVLAIGRRAAESRGRLAALHRQYESLAAWGDATLDQIGLLRAAGIEITFFFVPGELLGAIDAELAVPVGAASGGRRLVAVVDRRGDPRLPEGSEAVPLPATDRPAIRAEAAAIDAALKADAGRLARLAKLRPAMERERAALIAEAEYAVAAGGALAGGDLFAVQGWAPERLKDRIGAALAAARLVAAIEFFEPAAEEEPPTLVRYAWWTRPIGGLFEILGVTPGYREGDVAPYFMVAVPLFAAILIGDAGYGLAFLLTGAILYRRFASRVGAAKLALLIVCGAVAFAWGVLTGSFFGLGPSDLAAAGGVLGAIGSAWRAVTIVGSTDELRELLMKLSFIIAVVHLVLARLRASWGLAPKPDALRELGWALVLAGMFGVIWYLFFTSRQPGAPALPGVYPGLLAAGGALAIWFSASGRNPLKRILVGAAACLFPAIGTFGDTISYIRLMAVAMAGVYIAAVFNMLSAQLAAAATWFAAAPVAITGHALNIALCIIGILAHGVRLNMLEFSSNAGIAWSGYPFEPFCGQGVAAQAASGELKDGNK